MIFELYNDGLKRYCRMKKERNMDKGVISFNYISIFFKRGKLIFYIGNIKPGF